MMAVLAPEGTRTADPPANAPKKRVITPARKAQNRAAQQAYRERQRERKAHGIAQRGVTKHLAPRPLASNLASSPLEASSAIFVPEPATPKGSSPDSPDNVFQISDRIPAADPKMNTLRTNRDTIWEAVLNNAVCLGFDLGRLADCRKSYISPFFRSIKPQDEPHELVASTFDTAIPVHLQPTMAQILVPHHASLDLIPIPLLRDRLIMMSFAMPQLFDLWDLKLDIYVRHALVYKPTGSNRESQSWDQDSWKATSWFLQKWCLDWVKELVVNEIC